MNMEFFGIAAGILTTGAFLPQVYRTLKTQSTDDLSWMWLIMMTFGILFWTVYGISIKSVSMSIANVVTFFCLVTLDIVKWKCRKK